MQPTEPTHTELCLSQAEASANRSMIPNESPERRTMLATTAIAFALVAIGRELAELNAKRPVIPIPVYDHRAPLPADDRDDSLGED